MPKGDGSYYLKPARRTTAPSHLASVVVTTRAIGGAESAGRIPTAFSFASLSYSSRRRGAWAPATAVSVRDGRSLITSLEALAPPRGVLWVVSPAASASLVLSGFLPLLVERGAKWSGRAGSAPQGASSRPAGRQLASPDCRPTPCRDHESRSATDAMIVNTFCDRGKPDIIRYSYKGNTIVWVSGTQYFTSSESSLAESVGFDWPISTHPDESVRGPARDPADRAALWLKLFQRLSDWWRSIDGGPFAATPAGLAMSYVRMRIKPKTILSCQDPEVRKLEEASLFGGRASTWFYGPVVGKYSDSDEFPDLKQGRPFPQQLGPVDHYDIRAMYPTILATERFPVRKLHQWDRPAPAALADMVERWCVTASVILETDEPEYPTRDGARVTYPVGRFPAVLTTPDLAYALARGHVRQCFRAVTYAAGRPFAPAMSELLSHRRAAEEQSDPSLAMFVKLVSNAFGGKLAQRQHEWQRRHDVARPVDWGEWVVAGMGGAPARHFRARGLLVDEKVRVETPARPLAACFAHLTAYGRRLMGEIRGRAAPRSVVSQDTDGLWVIRSRARDTVSAGPIPNRPAYRLRLTQSEVRGRWYGPRHYWTGSGWVLAGMHDPARWGDGLGFRDSYSFVPPCTADGRPPVWVYECSTYKRLGDIPVDGAVGADGWAVPRRVRLG